MKSYSDLEQSRKLAEILPLESADMSWVSCDDGQQKYYQAENRKIILNYEKNHWLPCWSLAALLGVLPRVDIEKEICSDDTYDYRVKAYIGDGYIGDWFDNPVDACVAMIEKLHELKTL